MLMTFYIQIKFKFQYQNFYPSSEWWIFLFSSTVIWLPFLYYGLNYICCCGPFVFVCHVQFSVCGHLRLLFSVCREFKWATWIFLFSVCGREISAWLAGRPRLPPLELACAVHAVPRRAARMKRLAGALCVSCSGTGRWRLNGNRGMFGREGWAMLLWNLAEWLVPHLSPTLQMTCSVVSRVNIWILLLIISVNKKKNLALTITLQTWEILGAIWIA